MYYSSFDDVKQNKSGLVWYCFVVFQLLFFQPLRTHTTEDKHTHTHTHLISVVPLLSFFLSIFLRHTFKKHIFLNLQHIHSKNTYFWIYSKQFVSIWPQCCQGIGTNGRRAYTDCISCFVFDEKGSHKHMHAFKLHTHTRTCTPVHTHTHTHTHARTHRQTVNSPTYTMLYHLLQNETIYLLVKLQFTQPCQCIYILDILWAIRTTVQSKSLQKDTATLQRGKEFPLYIYSPHRQSLCLQCQTPETTQLVSYVPTGHKTCTTCNLLKWLAPYTECFKHKLLVPLLPMTRPAVS